jgi:hypothetical protein
MRELQIDKNHYRKEGKEAEHLPAAAEESDKSRSEEEVPGEGIYSAVNGGKGEVTLASSHHLSAAEIRARAAALWEPGSRGTADSGVSGEPG